ncbi:MAG TPA: hypothetical protein VGJ84_15945 [Polyangiaceae bacterium]
MISPPHRAFAFLTATMAGAGLSSAAWAQEQEPRPSNQARFPDVPAQNTDAAAPAPSQTPEREPEPSESKPEPSESKPESPENKPEPPENKPATTPTADESLDSPVPVFRPAPRYAQPANEYDRGSHDEERPHRMERRWSGWQTLLVDGFAVGSSVIAGQTGSAQLGYISLGTYLLGAPTIHWAHGKTGAGFGSLGLRAGSTAVFVMGVVGCAAGSGGACILGFAGAAGMIAAIPIDAAALAREEVPAGEAAAARPHRAALPLYVSPTIDVRHRTAGVQVGSSF